MKTWKDTQVCFIYDTEYCKVEEDDPKDAIVYFHPQNISYNRRCDLCLPLMGAARFMKIWFSSATLIKLEKGKFALRSIGKFILALQGGPDMPDGVLQCQLSNLIDLFMFYYDGFDTVLERVSHSRTKFLAKIKTIMDAFLSVSQCEANALALTFNVLPLLGTSKTPRPVFLRALHILHSCQKQPGVYAGCLTCQNGMLYSQLPASIFVRFAFLKPHQSKLPGILASTDFPLPPGVRLLSVNLPAKEFRRISCKQSWHAQQGQRKVCSPPKQTKLNNGKNTYLQQFKELENPLGGVDHGIGNEPGWKSGSPSNDSGFTLSPRMHATCDTDCGRRLPRRMDSMTSIMVRVGVRRHSVSEVDSVLSSSDHKNSIKVVPSGESGRVRRTTTSLPDVNLVSSGTFQTTDTVRASRKLSREQSSSFSCDSEIIPTYEAESEELSDSHDVSEFNLEENEFTEGGYDQLEGLLSSGSEMTDFKSKRETKEVCLYLQRYSETVVMLLMDLESAAREDVVTSLWKSNLACISDLELDVVDLTESTACREKVNSPKKYLYLQYDGIRRCLTGDIPDADTQNYSDLVFNCNTQLMHDEFNRHRDLKEITMWSMDHVIYGHKSRSKETYYQQIAIDRAKNDEVLPFGCEIIANIADKAKQRLFRDHGIVI